MKKVLILTYYWPPSGGSGVQRWMYFSKYLPQYGIEPVVVTPNHKYASYKNIDHSFTERVKGVRIYKTFTFEPLKLYSFLVSGSLTKGIPQGHIGYNRQNLFKRISSWVRANFFIPDARKGWNYFAIKKAKDIISEENIDIIITTGPPHSTHLIGLALKKEYGVKWIADFRDPWTDIYYESNSLRLNRSRKIFYYQERSVLEKADFILSIGNNMANLLRTKLHHNDSKFDFVYNGFDSIAMNNIQVIPNDQFTVCFIGLLTTSQPYKSLIAALKLFEKESKTKDQISLSWKYRQYDIEEFSSDLKYIQIDYKGYVTHSIALSLMKNAELLVNCLAEMNNSEILVSGKQMEYFATGNPNLIFGNPIGELSILAGNSENIRILLKDQVHEASNFIQYVYDKWKEKDPLKNETSFDQFSRIKTTKKLSEIIKGL